MEVWNLFFTEKRKASDTKTVALVRFLRILYRVAGFMKINYQRKMEEEIASLSVGQRPRLLLQCCCAPCSSSVLAVLTAHFDVTVYFYNPNIYPQAEYEKRLAQLPKLLAGAEYGKQIQVLEAPYVPADFFAAAKGLEEEPEGGARCTECFRLRLRETAKQAKTRGFDYFTTTLTVSPHKNAAVLNEIGLSLGEEFGVKFLPSDFKKKEGYKESIRLSKAYDLYRQDYCGCVFSMRESNSLFGK